MAQFESCSQPPTHPDRHQSLKEYAQELRGWMAITRQVMAYNELVVSHYTRATSHASDVAISGQTERGQPVVHLWDANAPNPQVVEQAQPAQPTVPFAGSEVRIPAVWKRVVAETADCLILLFLRVLVSTFLITVTGWSFLEILDYDMALISGEIDLEKVMLFSSEIYAVELIHRVFVTLYEASCIAYTGGDASLGGYTIGKRLMGIAVIECDHVYELQARRFTILSPIRRPSISRALIRSFIKNFSVSFMMPTFVTVLFSNNRRALHDTMSGTMVIEQA